MESRLDTIIADNRARDAYDKVWKEERKKEREDAAKARQKERDDAKSAVEAMRDAAAGSLNASIDSARTQGKDAFDGAVDGRGMGGAPAPAGGGFSVFIPVGKHQVNLNPLKEDTVPSWVPGFVALAKAWFGWGCVLGLAGYSWKQIRGAMAAVMMTSGVGPFPMESNIRQVIAAGFSVGVAMAPAVRLALLAILTTLLVVMPSALVQVFSQDWEVTGKALAATATTDHFSLLSFVADFIPLATIIAVALSYAAFDMILFPIQGLWMWLVKMAA